MRLHVANIHSFRQLQFSVELHRGYLRELALPRVLHAETKVSEIKITTDIFHITKYKTYKELQEGVKIKNIAGKLPDNSRNSFIDL